MNLIDEFRKKEFALQLSEKIKSTSRKNIKLMEFCGGHTDIILKYGIKDLLPKTIEVVSGPGCSACVIAAAEIDIAIMLTTMPDVIVASYGDMLRMPGSEASLMDKQVTGCDVRVVHSIYDALELAKENSEKSIVFIGIGFETTIPTAAAAILKADREGIENFRLLSAHKTTPGVLTYLLENGPKIDGFICPGHVTTIMGIDPFVKAVENFNVPFVVSGFEAADILHSIYMLVKQVEAGEAKTEIEYSRVVKPEGNKKAMQMIDEVFDRVDANWRGIGNVKKTGLILKEKYKKFDALNLLCDEFTLPIEKNTGCICGEVLLGFKHPYECELFINVCTPDNPIGACMVSFEGSCATHFKYK